MKRAVTWIALSVVVFLTITSIPMLRSESGPSIRSRTSYQCPCCGASRTVRTAFVFTTDDTITKGNFHDYYMREVDPSHQHKWVHTSSEVVCFGSARCGDGGALVPARCFGRQGQNPLVGVLSALPDRASRKCVIDKLTEKPFRISEMHAILNAYGHNPQRKDWPEILEKLGLYTPHPPTPTGH